MRKKNKHLERTSHFYENIVEEIADEATITDVCQNCGKGTLVTLDLKFLEITKCDLCEYQTRTKK